MLKRLLNRPEQITFDRLSEICARRLAKVYAKVRLADVLPVEGSGISEVLFEFTLQAHYDFVITDTGQQPLFAVEFDGSHHETLIQMERDAKKDYLSRRFGLPLLRVRAGDLRRTEWRFDRLTEAAERWFDVNDAELRRASVGLAHQTTAPKTEGSNSAVRPSCPACGSRMVEKNGKYGPFLSCDRFPVCKGSCDLPGPADPLRSEVREVSAKKDPNISRSRLIAVIVVVVLIASMSGMLVLRSHTGEPRAGAQPSTASNGLSATVRQMNLLGLLLQRRGWGAEERDARVKQILGYDRRFTELSKKEATKLITAWDDRGR